jgi:hypothetical protein
MSDHDELRSASDFDADAERFLDVDEEEDDVTSAVDLPPEGSVADVIDQRTDVPVDDEP